MRGRAGSRADGCAGVCLPLETGLVEVDGGRDGGRMGGSMGIGIGGDFGNC